MRAIASGDYTLSPELSNASSEFVATKDYMFRAPQPPAYLFVLDSTGVSVTSGMIACFAAAVKKYAGFSFCFHLLTGSPVCLCETGSEREISLCM